MNPAITPQPTIPTGYVTALADRFARCVLLTMRGATVAPTVEPGQAFLVDETATSYEVPGVYLLDEGSGPVAKRVEAIGLPGVLRVTWSTTGGTESYDREAAGMTFMGRVVGVITDC
jgi:hypothetical protein